MITFVFPGQGSQSKGMGGAIFDDFKELTAQADDILGYSIKKLCVEDPDQHLNLTQYTQPALYTVNAFSYLKKLQEGRSEPDYVAGHSLGEYDALFAAGAFEFATGLELVKKRGELMSRASGGGMAAVVGLYEEQIIEVLTHNNLQNIDLANYNSPTQIVLSGLRKDIEQAKLIFEEVANVQMVVLLKTSAAFHSRYMAEAKKEFEAFVNTFTFLPIKIPVISNVNARPYKQLEMQQNLINQITHPVKWTESIRYLMGTGEMEFEEIGPGNVLTGLVRRIKREAEPLVIEKAEINSNQENKDEVMQSEPGEPANPMIIAVVAESPGSYEQSHLEKDQIKAEPDLSDRIEQVIARPGAKANPRRAQQINQIKADVAARNTPVSKRTTMQRKGKSGNDETAQATSAVGEIMPTALGSSEFKYDYNLKYAYLIGGMYQGISSKEMVVKMGKAGMLGFLGTGNLKLSQIESAIQYIQGELPHGQAYGLNFLHNLDDPEAEEKMIDLILTSGVKIIEAAAFFGITAALVRYRAKGLSRDRHGKTIISNKIIAKVSRPEVAEAFLSPAPELIITKLLTRNKITPEEAELLKTVPMADDICAEADSGGYTDGGVAFALMPAFIKLRAEMMMKYQYQKQIRVGAAGGIGTPEAAAAAFMLGADFVLTGSINQCTVEAATSDAVKDLLQQINIQDTEYAPAGNLFELGAKVQVLKRGVFFPARANKLYDLYRQYDSISEIDEKTRNQIQEKYFKRSFDRVYDDVKSYCSVQELERAERSPKYKMALIFKWYFRYSLGLALNGSEESKIDYQVHCGPALGAFNQWVKGSRLENWRQRHVDEIAVMLMNETAKLLNQRYNNFLRAEVVV